MENYIKRRNSRKISELFYDFEAAVEQWRSVPGGFGFIDTAEAKNFNDEQIKQLINSFEGDRYNGPVNRQNQYRNDMGLDHIDGQVIFDFGCGSGIESMQYAKQGKDVIIGDISRDNLLFASRVFKVTGHPAPVMVLISGDPPFFNLPMKADAFIASGVLHHFPYADKIMERAWSYTNSGAHARLLLYSDKTSYHNESMDSYARRMDPVGNYATTYDAARVKNDFGKWWELEWFHYLQNGYALLKLNRRDKPL